MAEEIATGHTGFINRKKEGSTKVMRAIALVFSVVVLLAWEGMARSPEREVVSFSITTNVGFGNNIHVAGNHPDLGNWNPVAALKLRWTSGNVWVGDVAIQKGTALEYKFMSRSFASNQFCNGANAGWEGGANRTRSLAPGPLAPYQGKVIYYYTSWSSPAIIYTSGGDTNFYFAPMIVAGPGRHAGEQLFRVEGIGEEGEWIQFVMTDGQGQFDKSPFITGVGAEGNDYYTGLDGFVLQDGHLFNYWPAASVSAPRKEMRRVESGFFPPITGRDVVVVLPRGYDSHPWKRYPVVYFQDGQNITNGANVFGNGSWEADTTAHREAAGGRMREVILVGVYSDPNTRRADYNPPGDTYVGEAAGRADAYLNFLVHNVRPTMDTHYRTLNDYRNTMIAGSSMGGICSVYAATDTNVFGGALAMSPAVTRAPNYRDALPGKPKRPARVYMDTGTSEGQVGTLPGGYYWDDPWIAYDHLVAAGYVPNRDVIMRVGCGQGHNEAAWRTRLPEAFRFLLPARDEPNRIAQTFWPPVISWTGEGQPLAFAAHQHFRYQVEQSPPGGTAWTPASASLVETNPWAFRSLSSTSPVAEHQWFRIKSEPRD